MWSVIGTPLERDTCSISASFLFSFGMFLRVLVWNGLQGILDIFSSFSAFVSSGIPVTTTTKRHGQGGVSFTAVSLVNLCLPLAVTSPFCCGPYLGVLHFHLQVSSWLYSTREGTEAKGQGSFPRLLQYFAYLLILYQGTRQIIPHSFSSDFQRG